MLCSTFKCHHKDIKIQLTMNATSNQITKSADIIIVMQFPDTASEGNIFDTVQYPVAASDSTIFLPLPFIV